MDAAATTEAGRVSLQRKLLGEKRLCFRKSPKENGIKRRSRLSKDHWVLEFLLAGWFEEGGRFGRPEDAPCGCWSFQGARSQWVTFAGTEAPQCLLTDCSPCCSPQLLFPVLSGKCLGRKMGVEVVCEGREWIKERPLWERALAQLALAWGVSLIAKLWIIKPPTLSSFWMKYFSLWWKEAQGRCFNGCFWSENQIFSEWLPTPRKTSLI